MAPSGASAADTMKPTRWHAGWPWPCCGPRAASGGSAGTSSSASWQPHWHARKRRVAVASTSGQPDTGFRTSDELLGAHSRRGPLCPVGLQGVATLCAQRADWGWQSSRGSCGLAPENRPARRPAPPPRRSAPQRRSRAAGAGLKKNRASCKYLLAKFFPASISNPVSQPFGLLSD